MRGPVVVLAFATAASPARADRYEATVAAHPTAAVAFVSEDGSPSAARVAGGGGSVGMAYGLRNWLDVGAELVATTLAKAEYDDATVKVTGTQKMGVVRRTTRLVQLRGGATLRFGVGWVPTIYVGVGVGARLRGNATLERDSQGPIGITPDGGAAAVTIDIAPTVRVGLAHRINRHWSLGLAAGASYCIGPGAPGLALFDATIDLAYTWYPLW